MKINYLFFLFISLNLLHSQILFNESSISHGLNGTFGTGFVGGGISFVDFDNDGFDDVTLGTEAGEHILFFKNLGGTFVQIFPDISDDIGEHKQITWIDYDNDGDKDLYVSGYQYPNQLYNNDGEFNFTNVILQSGLLMLDQNNFGATWGDYDNDGYVDVFFSIRSSSQPNRLFKNNGDGTFSETTSLAGISTTGHLSFCASFIDYDKDGFQDLYIANDRNVTTNIMYHNNGDGTFTDTSQETGTGLRMDGMSTTIGDYNNDGWMDIYVTNTNELYQDGVVGNALLKNNGDGTFTNEAISTGTTFDSLAWGSVFLDAENDRDLDLYVSCMLTSPDPLPSAFYENSGQNTFSIPQNAGFDNDTQESYSNAIGDVDNDGFPDIIVSNEGANMFLWKNLSGLFISNNWLKVKLEGTQSNRDGLGSLIEVNTDQGSLYRYVTCGEGYISQNSNSEFFGLGTDSEINYIKVEWLSGAEDIIYNVESNQNITIIEGSSLNIEEFKTESLSVYPNPVRDTFVFRSLEHSIENLTIYDILGHEVLSIDTNSLEGQIDLSSLEDGTYYIIFNTINASRLISIIKN